MSIDSQTDSLRKKEIFSDAVLIAAVPAGIFLFAYFYEFGYASVFDIPLQLVSVTWGRALVACLVIFAAIIVWHFVSTLGMLLLPSYSPTLARMIEGTALFLLYVAVMLMMSNHRGVMLLELGEGLVGFVILKYLIWPQVAYRKRGKTFRERLAAMRRSEKPGERIRNNPLLIPASVLLGGIILFYQIGFYTAAHETEFYIVPTTPEKVVLVAYGNTFVLAPFNRKTKTLQGDIILVKLAEASPLTFRLEKVGPLKAPKIK